MYDFDVSGRKPIRHGEVLLVPIESAPAGMVENVSSCIVGHSESGHHHVLEGAAFRQVSTADGGLYVELDVPTPLRHHKSYQQHRELLIPAGAWRVVKKTEFDVRSVADPKIHPTIRPERIRPAPPRPRPELARLTPPAPRFGPVRPVRD